MLSEKNNFTLKETSDNDSLHYFRLGYWTCRTKPQHFDKWTIMDKIWNTNSMIIDSFQKSWNIYKILKYIFINTYNIYCHWISNKLFNSVEQHSTHHLFMLIHICVILCCLRPIDCPLYLFLFQIKYLIDTIYIS